MDYIFGHEYIDGRDIDTVKVVGTTHTDYNGEISVVRKYTDNDITDTFKVVRKFRSADGEDGTAYDWYEIKDHYRYIDKYTPQIGKTEQYITELEIESMTHGMALTDAEIESMVMSQALTDAEIAIMELQLAE